MTEDEAKYTYDRNGANRHLYPADGQWKEQLDRLAESDLPFKQWQKDLIADVIKCSAERGWITPAQAAVIAKIDQTFHSQYERTATMETSVTITCTACNTEVKTPFCPNCGKDYRHAFPEAALVAFHTRAVTRAYESARAVETNPTVMPEKKADRIAARFAEAKTRFAALASLLKELDRPCPIPDCCREK